MLIFICFGHVRFRSEEEGLDLSFLCRCPTCVAQLAPLRAQLLSHPTWPILAAFPGAFLVVVRPEMVSIQSLRLDISK